ncbi:MAG: hypothetical protein VYC42_08930 [Pseudomonadota bacterium]|nr:hypothetical protein [Pseudomonadota bacterium]
MASAELLLKLEEELNAVRRERHARRLAEALAPMIGINPHGIDVVCWLADADCRNNADALTRWVVQQLRDESFPLEAIMSTEQDVLLMRLERHLSRRGAANA